MDTYTVWVCPCCMIAAVNGDPCQCCADHEEDGPCEGCVNHPEGLMGKLAGEETTLGLVREEHSCDTRWSDWTERNCDCETRSFSWSSCDGCSSHMGGERYAFTGWVKL